METLLAGAGSQAAGFSGGGRRAQTGEKTEVIANPAFTTRKIQNFSPFSGS